MLNARKKRFAPSFAKNVRTVIVWNVKLSIFTKMYVSKSINLSKYFLWIKIRFNACDAKLNQTIFSQTNNVELTYVKIASIISHQ